MRPERADCVLGFAKKLTNAHMSREGVSDEDIRVSNLGPLPSIARSMVGAERRIKPSEPDYVPEAIAQSLKVLVAK